MKTVRHTLLLLFALIIGLQLNAQEISFTAKVDKPAVVTGEQFQLTITVVNANGRVSAPDLDGLTIVSGPRTRQGSSVQGGRAVSFSTFTWVLTAVKARKYTIGAARMQVGGGILETEPITIEVSKAPGTPGEAISAQGQARDPNIFTTITLSRNKGYVGEQVLVTYQLYTRYPNTQWAPFEPSAMQGFWAERLEMGQRLEERVEMINGLNYTVVVLMRQLLLPQRSGKLRIEPFTLPVVLERNLFSNGRMVELKSNALEFNALALPDPPQDFTGGVGELQMSVRADRTELKANEALEITLKLSGKANLKLIDAPKLKLPEGIEVYDPKVVDKISVSSAGMSGSREFQYLVLPRYEGNYPLPPMEFSYFDPQEGKYRSLSSKAMELVVAAGDGNTSGTGVAFRPNEVRQLDQDIRFIRTGDLDLRPKGYYLFGSWRYVAGIATPALAFLLLLFWRRKTEREQADVVQMRRKRAERSAQQHLKHAKGSLDKPEREPFHTALGKALSGYLMDRFGLGPAELNAANIASRLGQVPDAQRLAEHCSELLEACEMARFAPIESKPRQDLYNEAAELITRLENISR
ncbi:MAG: protein BatD [Flavobacteriales bacterium]|nr:protein BatD [Flavobacteriales bacterium]